jgi:putative NADH-flavin reductase
MFAVIGATGNTGRAVVKELWGLGHDPVCIVLNPAKVTEGLGALAKVLVADASPVCRKPAIVRKWRRSSVICSTPL